MTLSASHNGPMELFRVGSQSNPNATAGAIANVVRTDGAAELQVIGAGALNQAVKAIAIARTFLESDGIELVCTPYFAEVEIEGAPRTAIRMRVFSRTGDTLTGLEISSRSRETLPAAVEAESVEI